MPARHVIALDISRTRVRALLASRDGSMLKVKRVFAQDVPESIDVDDANELGQWIGSQLKEAGITSTGRNRATIALARQHVGLKRLTLPTTDEHELPDMTRLAMQRQLPFDAETAVIDFLPVAQSETSTTVLAVAVPQNILDHALQTAKAARLKVDRVSLRGMGSALLLRHLGEQTHESVLAVDVLNDAIEFCVIQDGAVRFSRAAELTRQDDGQFLPDAVLTETRRTWMSYRIGEDASDVRHVIIVGDTQLGEEVAEPLAKMLKVDAEVLQHHPLVNTEGHDMSRVWPLAGLLLEASHGGETIDFARPRKAPDFAAAKRKEMFIAAALVLLVVMTAWTFSKRDLDSLQRQVNDMQARQGQLAPEHLRYQRDVVKLRHLELWESVNPDWLEHLTYLAELAPSTERVVLDTWNAAAAITPVQYNRRSREWSAPGLFNIVINGEAVDRATADALRDRLVLAEAYATSSTGADAAGGRRLPYGFNYRLSTADSSPQSVIDAADAADAADAGGADAGGTDDE
jgi:hypothetical protein